ncbi:MAG: papain-like cysteine peptidase [Parachlamydia sp.]|nr:papain-like cysteine peptidase [Parachlamydia sp.]
MLKLLFNFFLFCTVCLRADSFDVAVSLGEGCQVAWQLNYHQYRTKAYPFDWLRSPLQSVLLYISNQGAYLFDADKLSIVGPYAGDTQKLEVIDLAYGLSSYHDFAAYPPFANYSAVKEKYDRRTKRFFKLLDSKKRILFIRQGSDKQDILALDYMLRTIYPKLNFAILAIHETEEYRTDWGMANIKNFCMPQIPGDWMGDYSLWGLLLSQFSIQQEKIDKIKW